MTTLVFDTLKFSRSLREKANLSSEQADGFAEAIADAVQADLVTKADLRETDVKIRESELKLEARIEAAKAETIKWVLSAIGFQTMAVLGAIIAAVRLLQP